MATPKPRNEEEYLEWLAKVHGISNLGKYRSYYESTAAMIRRLFESSPFWQELPATLQTASVDYSREHGLALLQGSATSTSLLLKPHNSLLQKTFRKNVLNNRDWPNPPSDGWVLPPDLFSRINDTIRTSIVAKYFDGVGFLVSRVQALAEKCNLPCERHIEARMEDGYYAAHLYVRNRYEIPKFDWDTHTVDVAVEIQITTQLQEVLRQLLHRYYEEKRMSNKGNPGWQWNYKTEEFSANYLGHLLHYIEGMIMELRDRQKGRSNEREHC